MSLSSLNKCSNNLRLLLNTTFLEDSIVKCLEKVYKSCENKVFNKSAIAIVTFLKLNMQTTLF